MKLAIGNRETPLAGVIYGDSLAKFTPIEKAFLLQSLAQFLGLTASENVNSVDTLNRPGNPGGCFAWIRHVCHAARKCAFGSEYPFADAGL